VRLAAIDIGSNAARLLISEVIFNDDGTTQFQKLNLVRVPLRLGFDVFEQKEISPEKETMIMNTMKAYRHLLNAYGVPLGHLRAAATSAMRDAVIKDENVFEVLMDAVRVCSLGQITHALFEVGGQYRRSM
jgi:exopolyphosphatase/guanosine-5'-triphosphate,3'-diphosphate pyrophosphatase